MTNIDEEAIKIIAKVSQKNPGEITNNMKLFEDLGLDSMKGTEILARFADKFGLEVEDSILGKIFTVNDALNLLKKKQQKKGAGK